MVFFKKEEKKEPKDLWIKCSNCSVLIFKKNFLERHKVCPKCGFHYKLTPQERVELLVDSKSFKELDAFVTPLDPLDFGEEYRTKLKSDIQKTKLRDAVLTGTAKIDGCSVFLGIMDFNFRGGSMGSVVGEKVVRLLERGAEIKTPVIVVTSSGGARMQEGMLSLMQMVRTSAAVNKMHLSKTLYIVVMTDPTTAGVAASFASLGDIILAEPGAIIGFSGARVIEQTIRQKLPPGFQTSEFYLEHGFIDQVIPRVELRLTLIRLLDFFAKSVADESKTKSNSSEKTKQGAKA